MTPDDEGPVDAEPAVERATVDLNSGDAAIKFENRPTVHLPAAFPTSHSSAVSRLQYDKLEDRLTIRTRAGEAVVFETGDSQDPLSSRSIVYLDQNQWSLVASARRDPGAVTEADLAAVRQLEEWVDAGKVILAASAAHLVETTKWSNRQHRYDLGLAVLQLSRGWQRRHPLRLRRDELYDVFSVRYGDANRVRGTVGFSLEPDAWKEEQQQPDSAELPSSLASCGRTITAAAALAETLLDIEQLPPGPAPSGWVDEQQKFTDWLKSEGGDRQQRRKKADFPVLNDLRQEILEEALAAGATQDQIGDWLRRHSRSDLRDLPALGIYREMLIDRHVDAATTWENNDLTDLIFLSCAGGYADYVVCERHMGTLLKQAVKRLDRPASVSLTLKDAVEVIKDRLLPVQVEDAAHPEDGPN